ncbi:hypothetical protein MHYP_G00016600 [Metynnis hypsauchen]
MDWEAEGDGQGWRSRSDGDGGNTSEKTSMTLEEYTDCQEYTKTVRENDPIYFRPTHPSSSAIMGGKFCQKGNENENNKM